MQKKTKKALRSLKNHMKVRGGKTKKGRVLRELY
jgi:hypothetical protein